MPGHHDKHDADLGGGKRGGNRRSRCHNLIPEPARLVGIDDRLPQFIDIELQACRIFKKLDQSFDLGYSIRDMTFFDLLHGHLGKVGPENRDVEVIAEHLEGLHGGDTAGPEGDKAVGFRKAVQRLVLLVDSVERIAHVVSEIPAEIARKSPFGRILEILSVGADGGAKRRPVFREDRSDPHGVEKLDHAVHRRNPDHGASFGFGLVSLRVEIGDDLTQGRVRLEPFLGFLPFH